MKAKPFGYLIIQETTVTTRIGIGFSNDAEIEIAARNAAYDAKTMNEQGSFDLVLVFASIDYNFKAIIPVINSALNTKNIIGASTSGIILADAVHTQGVAVLAITSDTLKFSVGYVENIPSKETFSAGAMLAQNTLTSFGSDPRQAFLFFIDGLLENNSAILKGLQSVLGNAFTIIGGGTSDDFRFQRSYQSIQEKVFEHSAVGALLGGQIGLGIGGRHGWRPLGKPRRITSAENNIIHTIDGKKACYIYEDYFNINMQNIDATKFEQMSILYPLGIFIDRTNEYLLRNAANILPDGSIRCQGNVQQGTEVHLMIGNKESCRQATITAAQEAKRNLQGENAAFIIVLESMARQKLLGRNAHKEIDEIRNIFGRDTPIFGMYTHGETYPFQDIKNMKKIHTQNESIVILAIRENERAFH